MTRFISYIRVSTAKQGRSGLGLEAQQSAIRAYLDAHGGELVAEYREVESGRHNDRAELAAALKQCRLLGTTLLIAKLDRLSRDAVFLLQLQASGIEFCCCDMPGANKLTVGMMALLAQEEVRLISERTRAALKAAKARGVKLGCPMGAKAFGDNCHGDAGRAQVKANADKRAADLADVVRGMQAEGLSLAKMAARLNTDGYRTARGGSWHPSTVRNLIGRLAK